MMPESTYTQGSFCWYELATRDQARAVDFYRKLIGWEVKDQPMGPDFVYSLAQREGKDVAGIYQMQGPQFEGVPPHWMYYVWVDDVDASAAKAKDLGAKLLAEPMDIPGVGKMAVFQDPTGAHLAIFHGAEHPGAARFENPAQTFCWTELMTRDTDRAGSFLTRLFGWGTQTKDMGPAGTYTMFMKGKEMVCGMMAMGPEFGEIPPHWMGYIAVADCDATVKQATDMGAKVHVPPTDIPDIGRFAIFTDPTQAAVAVITLKTR